MQDISNHYTLGEQLSLKKAAETAQKGNYVDLTPEAIARIAHCRHFLDTAIASGGTYYGVNTGFGALYNVPIRPDELAQLQHNLLRSHATGTGDIVPPELVRLMMVLKIQSLSYGNSGVQVATVQRLCDFLNRDIVPVVYEQGSLGASGDLAPLSHLCLPLIGEGKVWYKGTQTTTAEALAAEGIQPISLQAKEGLALINGTQFMSSYGVWLVLAAQRLLKTADTIAALSIDAYDASLAPFDADIHQLRPQKGQVKCAKRIVRLLSGSQIITQPKTHVQDPYSFRCVPQVHGASADVVRYAKKVFTCEINAITDNPLVLPDKQKIISGGHFHGQPLAFALDFLAIALAEIANISERRTYTLIGGERQLPVFLIENSGLNSGLMISQYTAAAIVSQNKQLCTPASVDSITSSKGQEDHVSMGANAATKCYRVMQNVERVLAIELLTAAQAYDFRIRQTSGKQTSPTLAQLHSDFRAVVPFLSHDRFLHEDIEKACLFVRERLPAFAEF